MRQLSISDMKQSPINEVKKTAFRTMSMVFYGATLFAKNKKENPYISL